MNQTISQFLARCSGTGVEPLDREEAASLLRLAPEYFPDLLALGRLFGSAGGAAPFTCGIINAKSGRCAENCAFCAQSSHHAANVPAYPLIADDIIIRHAETLERHGVNYFGIVASGTGPLASGQDKADFEHILKLAGRIAANVDIKLCASLGILGPDEAGALKQAGFTSCHHNLETSPGFYPRICGTHDIKTRVETVKNARRAGLRVCSGGIFGMGETWNDRLDLFALLAELDVASIPVNFLTPIKGTPLENAKPLPVREALTVVSLLRLMNPGRDIVICGGRNHALKDWDRLLACAGANGLMVGDYLTTKGSPLQRDLEMLHVLGVIGEMHG